MKPPSKAGCNAARALLLELLTTRLSGAELGCEDTETVAGLLDVMAIASKALLLSSPTNESALSISL